MPKRESVEIIQEAGRQIAEVYKSGGIPFPRVERIITAALHKYESAKIAQLETELATAKADAEFYKKADSVATATLGALFEKQKHAAVAIFEKQKHAAVTKKKEKKKEKQVETLQKAAKRVCFRCGGTRDYGGAFPRIRTDAWKHLMNGEQEDCEASLIHDLIAEIERREDDKERRI